MPFVASDPGRQGRSANGTTVELEELRRCFYPPSMTIVRVDMALMRSWF